jgi:cell division transport system permease protein
VSAVPGARSHHNRRPRLRRRLRAWLEQHGRTVRDTADHLLRTPLATVMTAGTLAIALALPAMLHLVAVNLEQLTGSWQRSAAIALFLDPAVSEERAAALAAELRTWDGVVQVELISRAQGLAEFREYSGLGGALDQLDENPLPVVLALYTAPAQMGQAALETLTARLEALPEGDFARLDAQWIERLQGIIGLLRSAVWLLGAALAAAVLLVIGNTIRLEIENRRSEIQIMDLVGATPAFVRRPFLYSGAWQGLLGGLLAWLLVVLAVSLLQGPVGRLAALYDTDFSLQGLDALTSTVLLAASAALGILGSWLAVGRHLSSVEPT